MLRIILLLSLFFFLPTASMAQKNDQMENRLKKLEKTLDSLKFQVHLHEQIYDHSEIEISSLRAQLALQLNRNFTYFGFLNEGEADKKNGKGYQRQFYFNGYHSESSQNQALQSDRAAYLKSVRQNLIGIKDVIVGTQTEPVKYGEDWTTYPNRLVINYYDNSSGNEALITADTQTNSLKVRINGVLQEVGWE
jgi:hypothetical protein